MTPSADVTIDLMPAHAPDQSPLMIARTVRMTAWISPSAGRMMPSTAAKTVETVSMIRAPHADHSAPITWVTRWMIACTSCIAVETIWPTVVKIERTVGSSGAKRVIMPETTCCTIARTCAYQPRSAPTTPRNAGTRVPRSQPTKAWTVGIIATKPALIRATASSTGAAHDTPPAASLLSPRRIESACDATAPICFKADPTGARKRPTFGATSSSFDKPWTMKSRTGKSA